MRCISDRGPSRIRAGTQLEADDSQQAGDLDDRDPLRFAVLYSTYLRSRGPRGSRHCGLTQSVIETGHPQFPPQF